MIQKELGKKVKQLREQRSWTQSLLAQSSGLSLRTIQRLEKEGNGSAETLLSVASAFDVDVTLLTEIVDQSIESNTSVISVKFLRGVQLSFRGWFKDRLPMWKKVMAIIGASLITVPLLFVLINVLRYNLGFEFIPDPFDVFKSNKSLKSVFNTLSPFIFLSSLIIGFSINLFPFLNTDLVLGKKPALSIEFHGDTKNTGVLFFAGSAVFIMLLYSLVENGILVL